MVVRNLLITWATFGCLWSLCADARGDVQGWLPDHEDKKLSREEGIASSLARQIEALPQVSSVIVRVRISDDSLLSIDRDSPSAVTIIAKIRQEEPELEEMVYALCRISLPDLSKEHFEYFAGIEPAQGDELVWLGPVELTRDSRPRAVALVAGFLGTWILMAIVLIVVGAKRRMRKRRMDLSG